MFTIAHNLVGRLSLLIGRMLGAVAAAGPRQRGEAAVPMAFWRRSGRLRDRLLALYVRFKAGKLAGGRRKPVGRARAGAGGRRPGPFPAARVRPGPVAAERGAAEQAEFLSDPEMMALIEAAPEEAGRILRPLCRLLNVEVPAALRLPRKARGRPVRVRGRRGAEARPVPPAVRADVGPSRPLTLPLRGPLPPGQARGQACPQGERGKGIFQKLRFCARETRGLLVPL